MTDVLTNENLRPVIKQFTEKGKQLDCQYERYIAHKVYGDNYPDKLAAAIGYSKRMVYKAFQGKGNLVLYQIHLHLLKVIEDSDINIQPPVSEILKSA